MRIFSNEKSTSAKFVELQTRKIISSYGGVGSIIETLYGAMEIQSFDKWKFFFDSEVKKERAYHIIDDRLLQRLKHKNGFEKLDYFVCVPDNVSASFGNNIPQNKEDVISAEYFPKWFYCNFCRNFKHINDWWQIFKDAKKGVVKKDFIPPRCGICLSKGKNKRAPELEQVRFIMTNADGDMIDIPWKCWNTAEKKIKDEDADGGNIRLDYKNPCCSKQQLQYFKSNKFSDLAGINVCCVNPECPKKNIKVNLAGLFGYRKKKIDEENGSIPKKTNIYFKPVIRTSNSVYYPILASSIYLPTESEIDISDQGDIDKYLDSGENVDFIFKVFAINKRYSKEVINRYIENKSPDTYVPELSYRLAEYNFLAKCNETNYEDSTRSLMFTKNSVEILESFGVDQLIGVKKLKITTVQTGYTRQEPLTNDVFMADTEESSTPLIKGKYTSKWGKNTKFLPAIESFGEGVFIALSKQTISNWYSANSSNTRFKNRIDRLFQNCVQHDYKAAKDKFNSVEYLARFFLIHTISHLLMKEFEFLCGYPTTSLSERLFVDQDQMQGFLIYTVAGAEGSFGGLVSQAKEEKILRIFKSALNRASDCASDPICYNTEQGIGGINMAACFSCTLVPETSCEEFNCFLDRSLLIDNEYGFFKNNHKDSI